MPPSRCSLVGVALSLSIAAGNHLVLAIAAFSVATMALYSFPSPFWALPTIFLSGPAAAASIALINATGNLGGFAGPYMIGYLADLTGGYTAGLLYLVMCGLIGSALVLSLRIARPAGEMPAKNHEPKPTAVGSIGVVRAEGRWMIAESTVCHLPSAICPDGNPTLAIAATPHRAQAAFRVPAGKGCGRRSGSVCAASLTMPIAISSSGALPVASNDLAWLKFNGTASCALIDALSEPTLDGALAGQHVIEAADFRIGARSNRRAGRNQQVIDISPRPEEHRHVERTASLHRRPYRHAGR